PDGKVYLVTASSMGDDGYWMGKLCILRDVTHFKELDALKSEFVSTVSHDLRSPLTLLRGYTTMLQMVGELNEQQSGYVSKIVAGVENMARLVNNLLDLGRIEAGVGLHLEMVQVEDIIERVIGGLQLQAAQKRIRIYAEMPQQKIPMIKADQALLQQVLHNLVDNAIKYTDTNGEVKVRLQVRPEEIVFEVHDTGIGIAPADQQRLFEKFYRATPRGSRGERGSGLGLAIVKSITERHGGRVWLKSQLGKGSIFYLALPIRKPD
ncbi:MAG: sensor histidine kinase, partial [Anaerolineales bacterium]